MIPLAFFSERGVILHEKVVVEGYYQALVSVFIGSGTFSDEVYEKLLLVAVNIMGSGMDILMNPVKKLVLENLEIELAVVVVEKAPAQNKGGDALHRHQLRRVVGLPLQI